MTGHTIRAIFHPEEFQGWLRRKSYFEGWYFKVVNQNENNALAIIPGIAIDRQGNGHAFIQVLDGKKRTAEYHRFDMKSFVPATRKFQVSILQNSFSGHHLRLHLPDLKGELKFSGNFGWPNSWYSPGIMGPYSFLPFMECNHGIISMDHSVSGQLEWRGEHINFGNGRGYIEKDWGKSFPSAYIWLQSNHFSQPGISLKVSVAKIPYLGYAFVGFIAGLKLGNQLIQFTTYNQSILKKSWVDAEQVELVMQNKRYVLEIRVKREPSTELASPIRGLMDGRIEESMNTRPEVRLTDRQSGQLIFADSGRNGGLEVAGKIEEIFVT